MCVLALVHLNIAVCTLKYTCRAQWMTVEVSSLFPSSGVWCWSQASAAGAFDHWAVSLDGQSWQFFEVGSQCSPVPNELAMSLRLSLISGSVLSFQVLGLQRLSTTPGFCLCFLRKQTWVWTSAQCRKPYQFPLGFYSETLFLYVTLKVKLWCCKDVENESFLWLEEVITLILSFAGGIWFSYSGHV